MTMPQQPENANRDAPSSGTSPDGFNMNPQFAGAGTMPESFPPGYEGFPGGSMPGEGAPYAPDGMGMPFPPEAFPGGYPPQPAFPDGAEFPGMDPNGMPPTQMPPGFSPLGMEPYPGMPYPPYGSIPFPGMMFDNEEIPDVSGKDGALAEDETDFKLDDEDGEFKSGRGAGMPGFRGMNALPPGVRGNLDGLERPHLALDLPWYFEFIAVVITALAISSLVRLFLLQPFYIPSQSMEKTLMINDSVLVNKFSARHGDINRGDIVVFEDVEGWSQTAAEQLRKRPPDRTPFQIATKVKNFGFFVGLLPEDSQGYLIKRVIGIPGDDVSCCDEDGLMTINGKAIDEDYIPRTGVSSDIEFSVVVPKNSLWVMGDNRPHSADSRWHQDKPSHGFVSESNVVGRAFVVVWPVERMKFITPSCAFYNIPKPATPNDEFSSEADEAPPPTQ
ncbi:signal peptidase I [Mobiluncus curtisii]|uniref:signal peptidase I n=1 Tax=Mobiluncus curtisii TaxID=2051 RepID=UPI001470095C|nr:signal peptidase I [Mobiluncus curtisii]NMW99800.1 signal peptidase I [Mobiluncus curtisii]